MLSLMLFASKRHIAPDAFDDPLWILFCKEANVAHVGSDTLKKLLYPLYRIGCAVGEEVIKKAGHYSNGIDLWT